MDDATARTLALGGATGLLVALLARVVVVPAPLVGAALPLVCAGGVVAGFVAGTVAVDPARAGRVGAAAGGVGGAALAGSLWAGMATLASLPSGTAVWWLAYLFATAGPVSVDTSPLVADLLVVGFVGSLLALHVVGGFVGARLAAARRGQ